MYRMIGIGGGVFFPCVGDFKIQIISQSGKVVKEINGFTQQGMMERFIDVSEFAAGLLLVEVQTGDQISVHKILKY